MHRDKTEKRGVPLLKVKGLLSTLGYIYRANFCVSRPCVGGSTNKHKSRGCCRLLRYSIPPEVKERAYETLVRHITEYACTARSPHSVKGIAIVKWVERRSARREIYKALLVIAAKAMALMDLNHP